jgi:hypothetical protein
LYVLAEKNILTRCKAPTNETQLFRKKHFLVMDGARTIDTFKKSIKKTFFDECHSNFAPLYISSWKYPGAANVCAGADHNCLPDN